MNNKIEIYRALCHKTNLHQFFPYHQWYHFGVKGLDHKTYLYDLDFKIAIVVFSTKDIFPGFENI